MDLEGYPTGNPLQDLERVPKFSFIIYTGINVFFHFIALLTRSLRKSLHANNVANIICHFLLYGVVNSSL